MTKEQVKKMMVATGQKLLLEDHCSLYYENPCIGEDIIFEFDENEKLIAVYS